LLTLLILDVTNVLQIFLVIILQVKLIAQAALGIAISLCFLNLDIINQ